MLKIALGSSLGIVIAAFLLGGSYDLIVRAPQQREARVRQARVLFQSELAAGTGIAGVGLTVAQTREELDLKDEDASSPCNVLSGESFASCASVSDRQTQRSMAAGYLKVKAQ